MTAHIFAGLIALVAAVTALATEKGGPIHRGSGLVFTGAMVVMAATGAVMAAFVPERLSVVAGGLTLYLVVTGLLTVRPPPQQDRSVHRVALGVGAGVAVLGFTFGVEAFHQEDGRLDGFAWPLYAAVGAVAAFAALADLRMLRSASMARHRRLARHLWRMCFALCITTASFFLGQAQVFPEPMRNFALLSAPVLLVLGIMGYWLVRVLWLERRSVGASPEGMP